MEENIPFLESNYELENLYEESYFVNYIRENKMDSRYVQYTFNEQELIEVMKGLDNNSMLKKLLQRRGEESFGW